MHVSIQYDNEYSKNQLLFDEKYDFLPITEKITYYKSSQSYLRFHTYYKHDNNNIIIFNWTKFYIIIFILENEIEKCKINKTSQFAIRFNGYHIIHNNNILKIYSRHEHILIIID